MRRLEGTNQKLLTRPQVAELLNLCERTVYSLDKSGLLPSVRIGRSVRYRPADIDRFIELELEVSRGN